MGDYGTRTRNMVTGVCMETGQKQRKGTKRMVTKTGRGWEGNMRKKRIKESWEDGGKCKLKSELNTSAAILTIIIHSITRECFPGLSHLVLQTMCCKLKALYIYCICIL